MTSTVYQPQNLIKKLREMLQLKSNGALARELCVPASLISRVQRCHLPVGRSRALDPHAGSDFAQYCGPESINGRSKKKDAAKESGYAGFYPCTSCNR